MTIGVSIHKLILPDQTAVLPGTTYKFGDEYKEFLDMGAVRPATEDEKLAFAASKAASKKVAKIEQAGSTENTLNKTPIAEK